MNICSFCAAPAGRSFFLPLCADCRAQLAALSPEDARYFWYVRAVKRALFGAEAVS